MPPLTLAVIMPFSGQDCSFLFRERSASIGRLYRNGTVALTSGRISSLSEAQIGALAAEQEVGCAPLGEIREVPDVRDIWRSQAEPPLAAHDKIACSFSRIFYDARCRSARRAVLIDAGDRAPLNAVLVFAEHVRHDTGWRRH